MFKPILKDYFYIYLSEELRSPADRKGIKILWTSYTENKHGTKCQ